MSGKPKNRNKSSVWPASTTPGEWVAAGLGLLVVAGMIGLLVYYAISYEDGPPHLTVEAAAITPAANGFHVAFSARNRSSATVAQVTIVGELETGSGDIERSEATLDYLPGHSVRKGGLFFQWDPRSGRLGLRAAGYAEP